MSDMQKLNSDIESASRFFQTAFTEVSKVIVGQKDMVEGVFMGLLTGGHVLLEGLPGLAKTLTISTIAKVTSLKFQRIQFTPDLLPSDLIGTMIFNQQKNEFTAKKGPIFTNIVLADEINRAPAKVQSALLEAMAEKQVTIGETTYPLESPFLVLATQNPIEQEGTYPLPEAQMDRFMFKVIVKYPNRAEEKSILENMSTDSVQPLTAVLGKDDILRMRDLVNKIYIDDKIKNYIVELVLATRSPNDFGLKRLKNLISIGGSPRATINLARASRAHAFLKGRGFVTADDVKAICYLVLRHRILLTYEAEAEDLKSEEVVGEILNHIEVP